MGDYLEGEKLRCSLLETIVERDSQDVLSDKLTRLFEMINEIKEDQFEMSSYKESVIVVPHHCRIIQNLRGKA